MKTLLTLFAALTTMFLIFACGGEKQTDMPGEQKPAMESDEGHAMEGEMAADMVVDPVCGMKIKKEDAYASVEYQEKTYYFCMEADKKAFDENPEKYASAE